MSSYLCPYAGILNLIDFDFNFYQYEDSSIVSEAHYSFSTPHTYITGKAVKDFYHIPDYMHSYFKANNLAFDNRNSVLEVFEGFIKGREDRIDFSRENGFTLCVKAHLQDTSNKIILAKGDLETENFYFILKQENGYLVFEYYLGDGVFTLKKEIKTEDVERFITHPVTFSIICTGSASPAFKIYRNNEFLVKGQSSHQTSLVATDYYLTNLLSTEVEVDKEVLQDVISISGPLEESDLYYINNLLDTNF